MHILTCNIVGKVKAGDTCFAMIPTYFKPDKFIAAKIYIDNVWFGQTSVFYHCMIVDLLDSTNVCMDVLPTALVRCIDKARHCCCIERFRFNALSMSKTELLNDINAWHSRYLLDIPAPFICETEADLEVLRNDIKQYFKSLI